MHLSRASKLEISLCFKIQKDIRLRLSTASLRLFRAAAGSALRPKETTTSQTQPRDPWYVNQADYKGQVVLIVPYLGYISPTLWGFRGGYVALPLIFVAFVFVLIFYMLEQRSQTKKDKTPSPKTDEEPKKDGVEKT